MEWQNQYGEDYEWFLKLQESRDEKAAKAGKESSLLPALANKPDLFSDLIIYYQAFQAVSTSRDSGFGIGYIKLSEIRGLLDEWNLYNYEDRLEWIQWIQFIDRIFVKLQSDKQKKNKKSKERKTSPEPRKKR